MQHAPHYADVVEDVKRFLQDRIRVCEAAGMSRERLVIDPGFGFGKMLEHNVALLKHLHCLVETGVPVLAGMSRKSMLGTLTGRASRRANSPECGASGCRGTWCRLLRVHDVAAMRDALAVWMQWRTTGWA